MVDSIRPVNFLHKTLIFTAVCLASAGVQAKNEFLNVGSLSPSSESKPRSEQIAKEDRMSLPEGGRALKGMEVRLTLDEINLYGMNIYGLKDVQQMVQAAVALHNAQSDAPKIAAAPQVIDKGNGQYSILVRSDTYLSLAYAVANEITQHYQKGKYFLSRAVVPAQDIDQKRGRIDVCVVEGFLASEPTVELKDNNGKLSQIKDTLLTQMQPLVGKKPLNFSEFERQLLLVRDLPGVNIQTTFQQIPSGKVTASSQAGGGACQQAMTNGAGATSLKVALGLKPFDGAVSIDNYGVETAGPWFTRFNVGANSRLMSGDRYSFDASISADGKELKNYGLTGEVPLGNKGAKLTATHRQGDAAPGGSFKELAIKNKTQISEVRVDYPLIRSRRENLTVSGKLKHQDIDTDLLNTTYIRDRIRTGHLKASYDFADEYSGVNLAEIEVAQGMSGNGATPKGAVFSSRPEASPNFTKYTAELRRYQGIPLPAGSSGSLTWVNGVKWQYADQPLFASEEMELGGRGYGRGAEIGVMTGDKGVAVKSQLEYDTNTAAGSVKYYGFVDHGKVWNLDKDVKGTAEEQGKLTSAGVGVNFEAKDSWYINAEVARPVTISNGVKKETNAYVGVGYKF